MGDQLPIYVKIILFDSSTESRHVDWNVDDAEERECEHGGYRTDES